MAGIEGNKNDSFGAVLSCNMMTLLNRTPFTLLKTAVRAQGLSRQGTK